MLRSSQERGFSLIEVLIVVAIISLATAIAIPVLNNAVGKGRTSALYSDGKILYDALMNYHKDHGAFPSDEEFDTATLAPLSTLGYIENPESLTGKMEGGELLVYLAPDVGGADRQFIAVMRLAADRSLIGAIVHTNLIDEDNDWYDGVFVIDEEDLEEAEVE